MSTLCPQHNPVITSHINVALSFTQSVLKRRQCIFEGMEAKIYHPRNKDEEQPRFLHISWLYAQDYCEYQLYLEQVRGVAVDDTPAMVEGSVEH